ncbi:hypothetical protein D3C76_1584800 [compost metagenome]
MGGRGSLVSRVPFWIVVLVSGIAYGITLGVGDVTVEMGRAINHRRIEMGGNQWLMGAIQMRGRPSLMCRVAFGIVMVIGSELLCGSFGGIALFLRHVAVQM